MLNKREQLQRNIARGNSITRVHRKSHDEQHALNKELTLSLVLSDVPGHPSLPQGIRILPRLAQQCSPEKQQSRSIDAHRLRHTSQCATEQTELACQQYRLAGVLKPVRDLIGRAELGEQSLQPGITSGLGEMTHHAETKFAGVRWEKRCERGAGEDRLCHRMNTKAQLAVGIGKRTHERNRFGNSLQVPAAVRQVDDALQFLQTARGHETHRVQKEQLLLRQAHDREPLQLESEVNRENWQCVGFVLFEQCVPAEYGEQPDLSPGGLHPVGPL